MNVLFRWPLRTTLPVFLFLSALILPIASYQIDFRLDMRQLEEQNSAGLVQEMTLLQGVLNNLLRKGDVEGIQAVIADVGAKPNTRFTLLVDQTDRIRYSNDSRLLGKSVAEFLAPHELQAASDAQSNARGLVLLDPAATSVTGYYPVNISAQLAGLQPASRGLFIISLDLLGPKSALKDESRNRLFLYVAYYSVVFALLALFLRFVVTRRTSRLVQVAKRISSGDLTVRADIAGRDELAGVAHAFNNMVEQILAERKILSENEERTRQIIDTALDALVTMDESGRITGWNPQAEVIFGWSAGEAIGRGLSETIVPPDQRSSHEQGLRRFLETGAAQFLNTRLELFAVRRNGAEFPVELTVTPVRVQGKRQFSAFIRDITKRKRAEAELLESEARERRLNERFFLAVEAAGMGVWDRDLLLDQLIWDDHMYQLFQVNREDFPEAREAWNHGVLPEDLRRVNAEMEQCIRDGKPFDTEFRVVWPNGEFHHIKAHARVVRDAHGNPIRMIGTNYDISERKRAEAQREDLQLRLQQAQKMEAIGTLAGGIAHDFNNILGSILGHVELLQFAVQEQEPVDGASLVEINRAANRAADLVRQILTFSRRTETRKEPLRFDLITKEALRLLRGGLPAIIEMKLDFEAEKNSVLADATHLHQVIMNLCTNAAQAMGEKGGILAIRIHNMVIEDRGASDVLGLPPGAYLEMDVSDTGCGIAPDVLEHVFEPFFTTKAQGEGTGLGLAVVHGIVQDHGGAVLVESELNRGATFRVILPLVEEAHPAAEREPRLKHFPGGNERILVVDDEESLLRVVEKMLGSLGYEVVARNRATAALDLIQDGGARFDLLITDLMMPQMTGIELCKRLNEAGVRMQMLLTTGYSESFTVAQAREMGFEDLLQKPIGLEVLALSVRNALDKKR